MVIKCHIEVLFNLSKLWDKCCSLVELSQEKNMKFMKNEQRLVNLADRAGAHRMRAGDEL